MPHNLRNLVTTVVVDSVKTADVFDKISKHHCILIVF